MHNVTVLMSTYNGSKYLREQIDSVLSQENVSVSLLVRDDGSTDETQKILEEYNEDGKLNWYSGKNMGPANSFFDLLKKAPESEYYAFCDQDDIWDYNKLNIAISQIQKGSRKYEIYCCGHKLVDKDLNLLRIHRLDVRRSLTTRMILSYVSGNTLVMNNALKKKITQYRPKNIVMHDAWCFKVAICLGADVHIDPEPHILYRQHEDNVVGMEISIIDKIRKFNNLIKEKDIYKQLIEIKYAYANEILPEYEQVLQLIEGNKDSISKKTRLLLRRDINFYNIFLNLAFKLKVITNNFA